MILVLASGLSAYAGILAVHILAGVAALLSLFVAIYSKLIRNRHRLHVISGRIFTIGMTVVFFTTVPLTILRPNIFLLVIGIFSFYLTFHGWRTAVNRKGVPGFWDKRGAEIMLATSFFMILSGFYRLYEGDGHGVTLSFLGSIGGFLALSNLLRFREGPMKGKERISSHIGFMMGAGIAAITAAAVTNQVTEPVWLGWIAPTLLLMPLIAYARRRHEKGLLPKL